MKFTRLTYSIAISDWGGKESWIDVNKAKEVKEEFGEDVAYRLIEKGKTLGIEVTLWDGKDKYIYDNKMDKICAWLFSRCYISADMRIVPCCVVCDSNMCDLGDARNFEEEWNSERFQKWRKFHLTRNISQMCRNCYYFETKTLD